VSCTSDS